MPPPIPILKDGTYFIINKKATNSAFDLSIQDMKSVVGYNRNLGASDQKWKVSRQGNLWTIQSVYNNGYLDVEIPGSQNNGIRLVVTTDRAPVKWHLSYDYQNQGWRIFYGTSNSCADLSNGGDPANFTPVVLWNSGSTTQNQVWSFDNV